MRGADYAYQIILALIKFPLHGSFSKQNLGIIICSTDINLTAKMKESAFDAGTNGSGISKIGIFSRI